MLHTTLFQMFNIFWKSCFPTSLESIFLKIELMQKHTKKGFSGTPIARFAILLELLHPGMCRIQWTKCIFSGLWRLFMKRCLPLCILPHAFWTTFSYVAMMSSIILLKNGSRSRNSQQTYMYGWEYLQDMSLYTCRNDVAFVESPPSNYMLSFANLQLPAERWCHPTSAFNIKRKKKTKRTKRNKP